MKSIFFEDAFDQDFVEELKYGTSITSIENMPFFRGIKLYSHVIEPEKLSEIFLSIIVSPSKISI